MKRPTAIQISIPAPCTQAWDDMQPAQGGRHCAHCQKVVVDFTRMTDAQLLDYFKKNAVSCGRLNSGQLERAIRTVEISKSNWWTKVAASILLAMGLSKTVAAQSKNKEPLEQKVSDKSIDNKVVVSEHLESDSTTLIGKVTNEHREPLINARVRLYKDSVLKAETVTDFDGNYMIRAVQVGNYELRFNYLDAHLTIINVEIKQAGIRLTVDARLLISKTKFCQEPIMGRLESAFPWFEPPGQKTFESGKNLPNGW